MKKILVVGLVALASVSAFAQGGTMSLADARAKIAAAVDDVAELKAVMAALDPTNQVAFLSELNAAIGQLPDSPDNKAGKYLAANMAAMRAQKGNLAALMAETYATVPPEALTVINERFASDLISRSADPAHPISDSKFKELSVNTMNAIQARTAGSDNAGVRDTFAVLMFLRASGGQPADLRDSLVANLPDAETRELAQNEWITPALDNRDYEPMLGAADAGEMPSVPVLRQSGPNVLTALLSDAPAAAGQPSFAGSAFNSAQYAGPTLAEDYGLDRIPRSMNPDDKWYNGGKRGEPNQPRGEPDPYDGQR